MHEFRREVADGAFGAGWLIVWHQSLLSVARRLLGASDIILNAIAGALQLDHAERVHLFDLARPGTVVRIPSSRGQIRASVQRTFDAFIGMALVRDRSWDYWAATSSSIATSPESDSARASSSASWWASTRSTRNTSTAAIPAHTALITQTN